MDFMVELLLDFAGPTIYLAVFGILILCGFGLPIPEDITLIAAGITAYYGMTNLWIMIGVSLVGVLLGDGAMWFLGNRYGAAMLKKKAFARWMTPERIADARQRFRSKKGSSRILFFARFMPGLRAAIFFCSGLLHIPYRTFLAADGVAALISVPAIIGFVYYLGDQIDFAVRWIKRAQYGMLGVIVVLALIFWYRWRMMKKRNAASIA